MPDGNSSEYSFHDRADLMKAMAHPVRLQILAELLKNPRCVTAIHEILDVRQPNISQHLTILKNSHLVASSSDGAYRCYYLKRPGLVSAILESLSVDWPEAKIDDVKARFKKALEKRKAEVI